MSVDIKKVLGTIAPWIAGALGGPLAGVAVKTIGDAIGLDQPTEESIQNALKSGVSVDAMVALKKADQDFAARMQELGFAQIKDLEQIAASDRDSARKREMSVMDWTPRVLAYLIIGGFMTMAYAVLFKETKVDSALAGTVIGYLSAKAEQVASYYFGSSRGSDDKTVILADHIAKQSGDGSASK